MNILFIIILLAEPVGISISVESGTIIDTEDQTINIKAGTFIPSPHDKTLAKKLVDKNSKIKTLQTKLNTLNERINKTVLHFESKSKENFKYWNNRYKTAQVEIAILKSPWNRWGKTIMYCILSTGVAVTITYLVVEVKN